MITNLERIKELKAELTVEIRQMNMLKIDEIRAEIANRESYQLFIAASVIEMIAEYKQRNGGLS